MKNKLDELKEQIKDENEKMDKLEDDIKKEIKNYKDAIMDNKLNIYDNKPFIQKLIFLLVGISNFLVGYAFYFLVKDNKNTKWQASYFSGGASIGLVLSIIWAIVDMVSPFIEKLS